MSQPPSAKDRPPTVLGSPPYTDLLDAFQALGMPNIRGILSGTDKGSRKQALARLRTTLGGIEAAAQAIQASLDPVRLPENVFDPTLPDVAAWTVVLALSAQQRVPLANIIPEYGAGVYALYYRGDHPAYKAICGTETPIYVGKADPKRGATPDVRTHGLKLFGRLLDHRRQIMKVDMWGDENSAKLQNGRHPLRLADFDCRKLACTPGIQLTAEARLIKLFQPLWNSEFNVAHGLSKHGDKLRKHPKSPWDVLHPGRAWATGLQDGGMPFPNQDTPTIVMTRIEKHVQTMPIYAKQSDVFEAVLNAFGQTAATADSETAARVAKAAEDAGLIPGDNDGD